MRCHEVCNVIVRVKFELEVRLRRIARNRSLHLRSTYTFYVRISTTYVHVLYMVVCSLST